MEIIVGEIYLRGAFHNMCYQMAIQKLRTIFNCFRVQMVFGTFSVVNQHGDLKQLYVMIRIFRGVEILQVVCLYIHCETCYFDLILLISNLRWRLFELFLSIQINKIPIKRRQMLKALVKESKVERIQGIFFKVAHLLNISPFNKYFPILNSLTRASQTLINGTFK